MAPFEVSGARRLAFDCERGLEIRLSDGEKVTVRPALDGLVDGLVRLPLDGLVDGLVDDLDAKSVVARDLASPPSSPSMDDVAYGRDSSSHPAACFASISAVISASCIAKGFGWSDVHVPSSAIDAR